MSFNSFGVDLLGDRAAFRVRPSIDSRGIAKNPQSITLPYVSDKPDFYKEVESKWESITDTYLGTNWLAESTIAVQPLPGVIGEHSAARGGNGMGLTTGDKDRFILEINQLWNKSVDDQTIYNMAQELTDWLYEDQLPEIMADNDVEQYIPLFMNDANRNQDVVGSYKAAEQIRALQQNWDPTGWWEKQSGGFKVQAAQAQANGQTAVGPPPATATATAKLA